MYTPQLSGTLGKYGDICNMVQVPSGVDYLRLTDVSKLNLSS